MLKVMYASLRKRQENMRNKKGGFTLIELIVVIAILAILMAILVPSISGIIGNAKHQSAVSDARSIFIAAQSVATDVQSKGGTLDAVSTGTGVFVSTAATGKIALSDLADPLGSTFSAKLQGFTSDNTYSGTATIAIKSIMTDSSGNITSVTIQEKGAKGDSSGSYDIKYPQS